MNTLIIKHVLQSTSIQLCRLLSDIRRIVVFFDEYVDNKTCTEAYLNTVMQATV